MLSKYAEEELNRALNDTLGPLVRAMVLKAEVMANPLANTTGHQGYTEPEKEVMHQVVTFLTGKVSAFSVTPADEPVLPDRLPGRRACAYGPRRRQHARRA